MDNEDLVFQIIADPAEAEAGISTTSDALGILSGVGEELAGVFEQMGATIDSAMGSIAETMGSIAGQVSAVMGVFDGLAGSADGVAGSLGGASGAADATAGAMDGAAASAGATAAALDAVGVSGANAAAGLDAAGGAGERAAPGLKAPADHAASLSDQMGKLTMPLTLAGVAIAAVGAISIKMAGDFQAGMTQLVTGAGESSKNLKMVSNGVLAMAAQTGESTKQLASGMYMIESAGYHGQAGLKILQAAAEGAKVGAADLGTVADATTTILNDFGSKGVTASNAVNALVATVSAGKTHMQDLSQSLAQILPTASAANVGLNDVMGAMATMTSEGVPAANAATYLRQTILALDAPSKAAQKALASVGLSTSQVSSAMQKSLPNALQMITDALAKKFPVGSAQYVAALKDISGGAKTMQGMLDLTGQHLSTFKTNVESVTASVKKGGSGIAGWAQVQQTMNQHLEQAGAAVQVVMIKLGEQLEGVANAVLGQLTPALQAFGAWVTTHGKQAAEIFEVLAVTIGTALVTALGVAAGAFIAANIAAIGIVAAVAGVVAVVALVAIAFRNAYQHSAAFRAGIQAIMIPLRLIGAQLENGLHKALTALGPVLQQVGNFLSNTLDKGMRAVLPGIMQAVKALLDFDRAITSRAGPAIKNLGRFIHAVLPPIEALWMSMWPGMQRVLEGVWNVIQGVVKVAWSIVSGVIKVGLDILGGNWKQAWADIQSSFSGVWDGVKQIAGGIGKVLSGLGSMALGWGKDMIQNFIHGITSMVGAVGNAAHNVASSIAKFLHFSTPDAGPLASIEQWIPDMSKLLTDGMRRQAAAMHAAARGMAGEIGAGFSAGMSGAIGGAQLPSLGGMSGLGGPGLAPVTAGGLYGGAAPGAGGALSPLGLAALTAEIQQLRGVISRVAPLGAAPTPANLGSITQNLGGVNISGVTDINSLYAQLSYLGGLAIENGQRGATAGLGL